ncbi:hypothetical protein, partial [Clostridium perfringens]
MMYEDMKKILKGIVENEFNHVQEFREKDFSDNDLEQMELTKATEELFKKLNKDMPKEYQDLLHNFYEAMTIEWINYCNYYFKEGIRAGLT